MSDLIGFLSQILQWLLSLVDWVMKEVSDVVMGALLAVLNAIPVPSFLSNASLSLGSLPSGVLYFGQAIDLPFGVATVVAAYVVRFVIRRIPIVG